MRSRALTVIGLLVALTGCHRRVFEHRAEHRAEQCPPAPVSTESESPASTTTVTQAEVNLEPMASDATSSVPVRPVEPLNPSAAVPPPTASTGQGSFTVLGTGADAAAQPQAQAQGQPQTQQPPPQTQQAQQQAPTSVVVPPPTFFYETAPPQPEQPRKQPSAADRNPWIGD